MKLRSLVLPLFALTASSWEVRRGDEHPFIHVPLADVDDYTSGKVHMMIMEAMTAYVDEIRADVVHATGIFDPTLGIEPVTKYTPCIDGYAAGPGPNNTYGCRNLDLYSFTPHGDLGSKVKVGNDIWGWAHTSSDGVTREFGLVGQMDGTAFVEVLPTGQIAYLGRLPTQTETSIWRDIKVIGHHAYIGSEAPGHGIQVFDLTKLLDASLLEDPKEFSIETDLTSLYDGLPAGSSHNVVAHEEKNLLVAVGSVPRLSACAAGLIFIDVSDPENPVTAGCAAEDGYVHDAQCLTYYGPDEKYNGTDVCYSFNEDTFTIYDISDLSSPTVISATFYHGVSYSHQGWVFDEKNQSYLLLNDEYDEVFTRGWATDQKTTTYMWDIMDLSRPVLTGYYKSPAVAIDHNLYIQDGLVYESNYRSGLRVVDASSIADDPTGAGFFEAAFFDVHPEDDAIGGEAQFGGAWSTYPYFKSGYILTNTLERGLFVVKLNKTE
ncbi:MYND-type domain-containing protein [Favolaschia claudopus]|uniref:MYND-type domain-containing protein n=1 Tax=Favolaschia claudopus TaxID=2862362 RepID=A0AAW0AJL3_9AGAR